MRRFIITVLHFALLVSLSFVDVFGDDYSSLIEKGIIDETYLDGQAMTRLRGLIPLLRAVGVDDEKAEYYLNVDFCKPVFEDLTLYDELEMCYIIVAGVNGVAYGESTDGYRFYFNGERELKVGEALLFAVRCIDREGEYSSFSAAYEKAKELGIVLEEEWFADLTANIDMDYYMTILERVIELEIAWISV